MDDANGTLELFIWGKQKGLNPTDRHRWKELISDMEGGQLIMDYDKGRTKLISARILNARIRIGPFTWDLPMHKNDTKETLKYQEDSTP